MCTRNAYTFNYNISLLPKAGNRHLSQLSVQIFYLVYHRKICAKYTKNSLKKGEIAPVEIYLCVCYNNMERRNCMIRRIAKP